MQREKATIKFWKQRVATWIFNHLWRDPESGMKDMIEKNIASRANAAVMGWLDERKIMHCRYCPIVNETPLKVYNGYRYCENHLKFQQTHEEADPVPLEVLK